MSQSGGYDINYLFQEAQSRWLKPAEVLHILQNHDKYQFTDEAPQKPTSGSVFLFNKRVLRFFRKDGHSWRKKKDGRTVGEAHERLKVGNHEALNCYYAHSEQNSGFQRRSYWMLDPAYEHIVLVHYRDINEGKPSPPSITQQSPGSCSLQSGSPVSYSTQNVGSTTVISDVSEPRQNVSSPEVNFDPLHKNNGTSSTELEVSQALRRLEEQLSLNDDSFREISRNGSLIDSGLLELEREIFEQDPSTDFIHEPAQQQDNSMNAVQLDDAGPYGMKFSQSYGHDNTNASKFLSWNEVLDSTGLQFKEKPPFPKGNSEWVNANGSNYGYSSLLPPQEYENFQIPAYSSAVGTYETNPDYYTMLFDGQVVPLESDSSLPVVEKQKFTIREISPEWGYANEPTKVIIVGSFLCNPSGGAWTCMFGDTEAPLRIIQEGVMQCEAPPHLPGKVSLCITSANRQSCSEVREFEYRAKDGNMSCCSPSQMEVYKSTEELLLLVRFVQMLLSDSLLEKGDNMQSGLSRLRADDDPWSHIIEGLLVGSGTSAGTIDCILQELLKEKLQQWLSSKPQDGLGDTGCSLSKKDQGIIHMVAGLGYEWALNPILSYGVSVNFRDINGWTALHWAARFGREKMVAALMASGASAGALTDPSAKEPTGKTPASIAESSGHKGLAGYLSEAALTSHLSSLTIEGSEMYKGLAEVEAEKTLNSVPKGNLSPHDDQASLKDTLAAVRNAAQAAARIQAAFRAHSFRKRQQEEATTSDDEYGIQSHDIQGLSAMSKLAFGPARDYNSAALSIQKKYRGWKGRREFLALRQKVVKIQAHVRGYQVRKNYKVCWAVGILEKVILRWRRKGVGLRGFQHETEVVDAIEDEEDILKVFRKNKVETAIDEAVSRVLSMVDSPNARQQYRRMLEKYRQAKAERGQAALTSSAPVDDLVDMENEVYILSP